MVDTRQRYFFENYLPSADVADTWQRFFLKFFLPSATRGALGKSLVTLPSADKGYITRQSLRFR